MAEVLDRFWAKVDKTGECWAWTGARNSDGYGNFNRDGRYWKAHRLSYETLVGEIAPRTELDHLCRNRACVNPDHLEAVTHQENMRRGVPYWERATRDACSKGHPYPEEPARTKNGTRRCRPCAVEYTRGHRARNPKPPREWIPLANPWCVNGHLYTRLNTRYQPDGKRVCRTCARAHRQAHEARKRAERLGGA